MEDLNYDVIICGGGPGGSACAMGFVDTDIKVAVIEKSTFPREKVCGDGMAPYIVKTLHRMSPKFSEAFEGFKERMPIERFKSVSYNGKTVEGAVPEPWFVAKRYHFDNFLYQQASALPNVRYFLEEQATNVEAGENGVKVQTNKDRVLTAKLLIGCDGATSLVRRQLTDYQLDAKNHWAVVRAYYSGVEEIQQDTFEFHFIPQYPLGYFWVFPSANGHANVGFGLTSHDLKEQKLKLREIFLKIIEQTPQLKNRFKNAKLLGDIKGWSIPVGYGKHAISGQRFMLVGDAASIADPSTGEGIGQAIVTGRIAAFHAKECFAKNDFTAKFMKGYDDAVEMKWGAQNRSRRTLSKILERPWLMNTLHSVVDKRNFLSRLVIRLLTNYTK